MAKFINVHLVAQHVNFGGEQAHRTCCAADRTGHAMLHTLYQKNLEAKTQFFNEWFAIDLVKSRQQVLLVLLRCVLKPAKLFLLKHARLF